MQAFIHGMKMRAKRTKKKSSVCYPHSIHSVFSKFIFIKTRNFVNNGNFTMVQRRDTNHFVLGNLMSNKYIRAKCSPYRLCRRCTTLFNIVNFSGCTHINSFSSNCCCYPCNGHVVSICKERKQLATNKRKQKV